MLFNIAPVNGDERIAENREIVAEQMTKLRIRSGDVIIRAGFLDTPTAQAIQEVLPLRSQAQTWGNEVYFEVPVRADMEPGAKNVVGAGEIAFWVQGYCIAIGFGRTPISRGDKIRLAARTNIWARALYDVRQLSSVTDGDPIFLEPDPD
jgi:hypothetical protein